MTTTPTYEEIVSAKRATGLLDALRAMQPGDVLDATDLTNAQKKRSAVASSARQFFGPGVTVTRLIEGRVYVALLRPEDRQR